jgi:antitoxin YobK
MFQHDELADAMVATGHEIFWQGAASEGQIRRLEKLLGVPLPESFRQFLLSYGGGGVVGAEISGIEDDDAELDTGGTVLGDTNACRKRYDLPPHLVTIYFHDDEVCWCLDTSHVHDSRMPRRQLRRLQPEDRSSDREGFLIVHAGLFGCVR